MDSILIYHKNLQKFSEVNFLKKYLEKSTMQYQYNLYQFTLEGL